MARRHAYLAKASADARRRSPTLALLFLAAAIAVSLSGGGVAALQGVERSFAATVQRLGTPEIWFIASAEAVQRSSADIEAITDVRPPSVLYLQGRGALRRGTVSIPGVLRQLELPRPMAEHLTLAAGRWPTEPDEAVLERGAARALGVQAVPDRSTVTGALEGRDVAIVGIVRDVSQASYPLSTPALVYLHPTTWHALVGSADAATLGIQVAEGAQIRAVARQVADLQPPGTPLALNASRWVVDGLSPLTLAYGGFLVFFGIVALAATAVFTAGSIAADVVQRSREIGVLQATGWSRRDLSRATGLPYVLSLTLGGIFGIAGALVVGSWATTQLVTEMGLDVHADAWFAPLIALAFLYVIALLSVRVGVGRVAHQVPSAALSGSDRALPGPLAAILQELPLPLSARVGASLLLSRPRNVLQIGVLLLLALTMTLFATVSVATVERFSNDPSVWGFGYDWQIRPLRAGDERLDRVISSALGPEDAAEPVYVSKVTLPSGARVDAKFIRADSQLIRTALLSGEAPSGDRELLAGAGLARAQGLAPGTDIDVLIGTAPFRARVVGIYRELDNLGQWFLGREDFYRSLQASAVPAYYVARVAPARRELTRAKIEAGMDGQVLIADVQSIIDFPLRDALRTVLFGAASALILLAATLLFATVLVITNEQRHSVAVLRALGMSSRRLFFTLGSAALVLVAPTAFVAAIAGPAIAVGLLGVLSAQVGGIDVVVPPQSIAMTLLLALVAPVAGLLGPAIATTRNPAVHGLRAER